MAGYPSLASARSRSIPAPIPSRLRLPCNRPRRSSAASRMPTPAGPSPMPWSHRARPIPRPTPRGDSAFPLAPVPTGRFGVRAQSPDGAPYLMTMKQGEWPKGAIEQSVDIALPRGVVVRGKITEEGTGRPVAGAVVLVTSPSSRGGLPAGFSVPGVTGPDGTYRVAAPPGPGYLVVQGPDDDYVLREFGGEGGHVRG